MAKKKKKNADFRSKRDGRRRKSPNDGVGWADKLLNELDDNEEQPEQLRKKRKGAKENAKRIRGDHA